MVWILSIIILSFSTSAAAGERPVENKVLSVAQEMASAFQRVEDYTCDVEITYYRHGMEDEDWRFKFYFTKKKKIRVDFSHPYPGTTIMYRQGDKKATVIPFSFLPALKFNISIKNPMLKTPAGQRIDQTDMGFFIDFLLKSLKKVEQKDNEFQEDAEHITFLLWALDYIHWEKVEKYRIVVSKKNWFPIRIERYDPDGKPMEVSQMKNYSVNTQVGGRLFHIK